jgi:hypothetical protein
MDGEMLLMAKFLSAVQQISRARQLVVIENWFSQPLQQAPPAGQDWAAISARSQSIGAST